MSEAFEVVVTATSADGIDVRLPIEVIVGEGAVTTRGTLDLVGGYGEARIATSAPPIEVRVDLQWTAVRELTPTVPGPTARVLRIPPGQFLSLCFAVSFAAAYSQAGPAHHFFAKGSPI